MSTSLHELTWSARIIAENGNIVTKDNIRGEAYIRSPSLFSGYVANPEANATAFCSDGFYKTGDCVFARDGKIFIDGRMKVVPGHPAI